MKKDKKKPKYNKWKFMVTFVVTMALLAAVRHVFSIPVSMRDLPKPDAPSLYSETYEYEDGFYAVNTSEHPDEVFVGDTTYYLVDEAELADTLISDSLDESQALADQSDTVVLAERDRTTRGSKAHRVIGVHSWDECFPDINDVQLAAAQANGIQPVSNRREAQQLVARHQLVNICHSPFYAVDNLTHSMPYLVPKAQHLLNTICLNFIDSLQVKGIPPHMPIVTSVLRTVDDVARLQRGNKNATTNSCHCYGTTVDITYNRFIPLTGAYDPKAPLSLWELRMKQVLAEVLRDLRAQGQCYVKYERKQACFHLTVR